MVVVEEVVVTGSSTVKTKDVPLRGSMGSAGVEAVVAEAVVAMIVLLVRVNLKVMIVKEEEGVVAVVVAVAEAVVVLEEGIVLLNLLLMVHPLREGPLTSPPMNAEIMMIQEEVEEEAEAEVVAEVVEIDLRGKGMNLPSMIPKIKQHQQMVRDQKVVSTAVTAQRGNSSATRVLGDRFQVIVRSLVLVVLIGVN